MSKLKTPVLSLGAKGSLGKELTFRESRSQTIAEKTPIPSDPRSHLQLAQRWLYQDYIAFWNVLTAAEKQTWQSAASRYHRTGLAHFMSYCFTTFPRPVAWWKLDETGGTLIYDSSRNINTGINVGATPAGGVLDGSYFFDGINDFINCGNNLPLQITGDISVATIIKATSGMVAAKADGVGNQRSWLMNKGAGVSLGLQLTSLGANAPCQRKHYESSLPAFDNFWRRVGFTFEAARSDLKLYVSGFEDDAPTKLEDCPITQIHNSTADLTIGSRLNGGLPLIFFSGYEDDLRVYDGVLPLLWWQLDHRRL